MPVDSKHLEYRKTALLWEKINDVLGGEEKVKGEKAKYLPALEGQSSQGYENYLTRASFYEATSRTVDGLVGSIFRKPPVETLSTNIDDLSSNSNSNGEPLEIFVKSVTRDVLAFGRAGVLVDAPPGGGEPFLAHYKPEDIINWRSEFINGTDVPVMAVLRETAMVPKEDDPFEMEEQEVFRELSLDITETGRSIYIVRIWKKGKGAHKDSFIMVDEAVPVKRGEPLDFIPFEFFGPMSRTPAIQRSPILGLVNLNLSHYRTTADVEHGAHFTALPTPWVAGDIVQGNNNGELAIGAGVAWQLEVGATVGLLEYTGQGLDALRNLQQDKERRMAVLGARLLEEQKNGVESAKAIGLRHRGENSILSSIAGTVSRGMEAVLNWADLWSGGNGEGNSFELNQDFVGMPMQPSEMVHLVKTWQTGGIGQEALFYNLKKGERLPPGMTYEEYQTDIEQTDGFFGVDDDLEEEEAEEEESASEGEQEEDGQ
jgi:hypothetical protein